MLPSPPVRLAGPVLELLRQTGRRQSPALPVRQELALPAWPAQQGRHQTDHHLLQGLPVRAELPERAWRELRRTGRPPLEQVPGRVPAEWPGDLARRMDRPRQEPERVLAASGLARVVPQEPVQVPEDWSEAH